VILDAVRRLDAARFTPIVGYLCGPGDDVSLLTAKLDTAAIPWCTFRGRPPFDPQQFMAVRRFVRSRHIALVHCNDPKSDVYGALLRPLLARTAMVTTLHGWTQRSRKGRFYGRLDRWAVGRFDLVVAVSEHTAGIAGSHGIRNVAVVHNGIDADAWQPDPTVRGGAASRPLCVGFVGRLSAEKGPIDFVRVARRVVDAGREARFIVAGDGPEREPMMREVQELDMCSAFQFRGHVGEGDLRDVYRELDVLMLPSAREGLPMSLLEACATGVCVVATRVGGVPEAITHDHNGLLADAGDVETLSRHVLALAEDPSRRESLMANARRTIEEHFTLESNLAKLQQLYEDVLGGGALRGP